MQIWNRHLSHFVTLINIKGMKMDDDDGIGPSNGDSISRILIR